MPPEQQLADYLAGVLVNRERAELEAELTAQPEALRELVDQRRLDAALGALLDPKSEHIETAIMASVRGATHEATEARVLAATVFATLSPSNPPSEASACACPHADRSTPAGGESDGVRGYGYPENGHPIASLGRCLCRHLYRWTRWRSTKVPTKVATKAVPAHSPFSSDEVSPKETGGFWEARCAWLPVKPRWRWAGVAVAALLMGLWTMSFWSTNHSNQRRQPGIDLALADRESELLRELAPLVVEPPVWTGSEQQSAWLTALAAITDTGGNEP